MKEMRQILSRARELRQRGEGAVLATVVSVEGSAYRREGARMLIEGDGRLTGVLSGGCLEQDLAERAAAVLASGEPAVATYDLRAPDEILWGLGLGCGGKITLLLQPLSGATEAPSPLEPFERVARERRPDEIETRMGSELLLREAIVPPTRLVLAGAGRDAVPLARFADELGWETIVLDARPTAAARERFAGLARVAPVGPRDFAAAVTIDTFSAVVVLTHNYLDDLAWLAALLPSAAPYVGLLGPATRRDRLLADLAMQGMALDEALRSRLHGPAGLDLGGRAPEQVALAIVAEIQAAMTGATAAALSRPHADAAAAAGAANAELPPTVVREP
jgi:xanthine dehydrogenase accessory factor